MKKETKSLRCVRGCEIFNVGAFKQGESITDPEIVEKLKGHPYFEEEKSTEAK